MWSFECWWLKCWWFRRVTGTIFVHHQISRSSHPLKFWWCQEFERFVDHCFSNWEWCMIFEIFPTIFVALGSSSKLYKFAAVLVGIFNRLLHILPGTFQFVQSNRPSQTNKNCTQNLDLFFSGEDGGRVAVEGKFYWQWIRKWAAGRGQSSSIYRIKFVHRTNPKFIIATRAV